MFDQKKQRVGVYGFVLNNQKQFLLVKRAAHDSSPNLWELPGGGLDHKEQPEIGAVREVLEETGLVVKACFALCTSTDMSKRDPSKQTIRIAYVCKVTNESHMIKHLPDHSEYLWVKTTDQLPTPVGPLVTKALKTISEYPQLLI